MVRCKFELVLGDGASGRVHESAAVSKGLLEEAVQKKTHPDYRGGAYMIVKTVT